MTKNDDKKNNFCDWWRQWKFDDDFATIVHEAAPNNGPSVEESINVTSFLSISCSSNSEYWSQKTSQSSNIHSINKMSMLQAWAFYLCERLLLGTLILNINWR